MGKSSILQLSDSTRIFPSETILPGMRIEFESHSNILIDCEQRLWSEGVPMIRPGRQHSLQRRRGSIYESPAEVSSHTAVLLSSLPKLTRSTTSTAYLLPTQIQV